MDFNLSASEIKQELGLTPKQTWRLVTDEAIRGFYLGFNATTGDVWTNDEHAIWINRSGNKTSMVTHKSVTLGVPPPANDEWANQVVADLEQYYKNKDTSRDNDGVIRLVPLPEHKTTLRKTVNGWELK